MKTLGKIILGLIVFLLIALLVLRLTGFEPKDRRPGLWLKGDLVTTPVDDWSFTDKIPTIEIQTNTPYLIPHSVTTGCTAYNGQLYLTSVYPPGLQYPNGRSWNRNVVRDPHVRLKIGDKLYDRTLVYMSDPDQRAAVLGAKHKKYPQQQVPPPTTTVVVYHVMPD